MPEWVSLWVVITLLLSLLGVVGLVLTPGLLSVININIQTGSPPIKNITFAYKFKEEEEPYKSCVQLLQESRSIGPTLSCVGVFYDDPKKMVAQRCRCAVGSILSEGDTKPNEELLKRYEESGFNVFSFPEVSHVVTTSFPRTLFSLLLGVRRVYPRLEHYIKERRLCAHPFLEIYRGDRIQYMVPLARQGAFYVPEVRQVERRPSARDESHSDTDNSDSNSEYSPGSGILLSDSRDTSRSSVDSARCHHQGSEDFRERSSMVSSSREPDWEELTAGQQARAKDQTRGISYQKDLDSSKGDPNCALRLSPE
ncbi:testis-expressed protein 264-like [Diretmus argenteus]